MFGQLTEQQFRNRLEYRKAFLPNEHYDKYLPYSQEYGYVLPDPFFGKYASINESVFQNFAQTKDPRFEQYQPYVRQDSPQQPDDRFKKRTIIEREYYPLEGGVYKLGSEERTPDPLASTQNTLERSSSQAYQRQFQQGSHREYDLRQTADFRDITYSAYLPYSTWKN